ncbi:MAG: 4-hydroxybutyrate dehydrogenase [Hyphomonadaceae bacterium]|nr:MAG: 4-hydroxybutyrate dehydrogenase [Hyphomonadaceae bacterium]KAF0186944.1 MAG: 4-hydroxybutyrate dehydrogenase [Hyphomonadaceae bacterium]
MANINYLNQCIFDNGAISQLPRALKSLGINSPLLVTDKGIKNAGVLEQVLSAASSNIVVFDCVMANPTEAQTLELVKIYQANNCDGFIALGGGSSIDIAKAAALLATHEGELARFGVAQRGGKHIGKVSPIIAIPTTAGTGSEVSVAAMIIMESGTKEIFISPNLIPPIAICDPLLTVGLPPHLTAATGMDAFTHCLEAVLSPAINPPAEAIGLDGIERIYAQDWLYRAVFEPTNADARWHMLMASTEGALAFVKGLGACHALAHSSSRIKSLNLHHGALNAIFLPWVLEVIEVKADEAINAKLWRIKRAMGIAAGKQISEAVFALNKKLNIPPNLAVIGLKAEHCNEVVEYALLDFAHITNCIIFDENDYREIFLKAL